MPGIYINDGGQTSSALANMLGGIATNLSPETQARAQLLREQTESADRDNWLKSATQQGVLAVPSALVPAQADPGAAAAPASPGTVASTLAAAAQPPAPTTAFGSRDQTAGFSPYARVVAGSYAQNPSMENFATGVNLGRDINLGPGQDYPTQSDIAKAKAVPYNTVPGETHHVPGGALPETTTGGGSPAETAAQTKLLEDTTTEALAASKRGAQAISDQAELQDIVKGYDALINIPDGDLSTPAGLEFLKAATEATGGKFDFTRFSSKQEAINDLTARLQGMLGSARVAQGDPALRGGIDVMLKQLDVAKNASPSFHRMTDAFNRQLQVLIDEGDASGKFLDAGPTAETATALRNQVIQNRVNAANELRKSGFSAEAQPPDASASPTTTTPAPAQPTLRPATAQEIVYARQAVQAGQPKEAVIAHAKQKGFDLGPNF